MDLADQWDALTAEQLRSRGSLKWTVAAPGVIGAWVAEMDFGTAPCVTQALAETVARGELGYPPPSLVRAMREATAGWYAHQYGWAVDPDDVAPLPDVVAGLQAAITHVTAPGSAVVVPTPAYMPFLSVPGTLGREVRQVPMLRSAEGRYTLDLDAIAAELDAGAGLVVLANPANPVGRVYSVGELAALADVVAARGARVFSDEIHAPLTLFGHRHVPFASVSDAAARVALTATAASKAWNLPGLKCAQLILSNDADREVWSRVGELIGHGASTPGLRATASAYIDGGSWLDAVRRYLEGNVETFGQEVAAHLPEARVAPLEGTYLAWLDLRAYAVGDDPGATVLERAQVLVNSGPTFGTAGAGCVRVNLAMPRPLVREAVRRIGNALAGR